MPKAKVTKNAPVSTTPANRTPVKINSSGTPLWYKIIMFGLMLAGLLWLVVQYIFGPEIAWMAQLNAWTYLIGVGLFIMGLLMTTGWR